MLTEGLKWFLINERPDLEGSGKFHIFLTNFANYLYLQLLAAVEVDIVLPAVPGLVLVGEPGVEGDGLLAGLINKGGVRHRYKNARNSLKYF